MVKLYDIRNYEYMFIMKYVIFFYSHTLKTQNVRYIHGIHTVIYFLDGWLFSSTPKQANNEDKKNTHCGEKYNEDGDKCAVDRGRVAFIG